MVVKSQVSAILNKRMDRQGFLKHVAIGVVALTGASAALRLLGSEKPADVQQSSAYGYGGSVYGGEKVETKDIL